jgi:hypothetical protein
VLPLKSCPLAYTIREVKLYLAATVLLHVNPSNPSVRAPYTRMLSIPHTLPKKLVETPWGRVKSEGSKAVAPGYIRNDAFRLNASEATSVCPPRT